MKKPVFRSTTGEMIKRGKKERKEKEKHKQARNVYVETIWISWKHSHNCLVIHWYNKSYSSALDSSPWFTINDSPDGECWISYVIRYRKNQSIRRTISKLLIIKTIVAFPRFGLEILPKRLILPCRDFRIWWLFSFCQVDHCIKYHLR